MIYSGLRILFEKNKTTMFNKRDLYSVPASQPGEIFFRFHEMREPISASSLRQDFFSHFLQKLSKKIFLFLFPAAA